ncbi:MAG: DUF3025 domain-containing protein [Burkholderiaceae bacterium]
MAAEPLAPWLAAFDAEATRACLTLSPKALQGWFDAVAKSRHLTTGRGAPLRMVDQLALPTGCAYETHIAQTGGLPTRDNLHDRYNALMWLHLPKLKASLNALQAEEIDRSGHRGNQRGPWRDWATLLDESGVLVVALRDGQLLRDCWDRRDWSGLFWGWRSRWQLTGQSPSARPDWQHSTDSRAASVFGCPEWSVWPLGHALLEKGHRPYKAITAQAWVLDCSELVPTDQLAVGRAMDWGQVDHWASQALHRKQQAETDRPSRLWPLPIMGVPGWCRENQSVDFYRDTEVFRSAKSRPAPGS